MGITIYFSNRLENLARQYSQDIQKTPETSLFSPTRVVTQTAGMGQWLNLFTAQQRGIAANTAYGTPEHFLRNLMAETGICTEDEMYSQEDCLWDCFSVFEGNPAFFDSVAKTSSAAREVADYIRHDSLRRYDLAAAMADLFDQYAMYRPDMLTAWEENRLILQDDSFYREHEIWQSELFRHVQNTTTKTFKHKLYIKTLKALNNDVLERMRKSSDHLFFFGISILPPQTVQILSALGEQCDLTFYFLNPSPHYWYDLVSEKSRAILEKKHPALARISEAGNPLLVNNGATGRELFSLFMAHENCINAFDFDLFDESFPDTRLGSLQRDISQLNTTYSGTQEDDSIIINSAITPLREVEVLYEYLLRAMDEGTPPDEILVMAPDIDLYRPYIEAVFSPDHQDTPSIAFTISDYSYDSDKSLISLFEKICYLNTTSFTGEDVFAIAEHPRICAAFGFARSDLFDIRRIVKTLGLRWGSDAAQAEREGTPANRFHSWEHIMHTAFFSGAVKKDEEPLCFSGETYLCQDLFEGAAGEPVFAFFGFIQTILDFTRQLSQNQTPVRWAVLLKEWLIRFFPPDRVFPDDEQGVRELSLVQEKLDILQEHTQDLREKQTFSLIRTAFFDSLRTARKGAFLARGITFCSPVPMRSIPFEVVAFLGMNSGEFPRLAPPRAFNLMETEKRPGDRDSKNSDRYLFLEALISARKLLYLSYLGRDQHDMSEKTPATVVTELLEYVNREKERVFVQHHPLYGFDPVYFSLDPAWFTYQYDPPAKKSISKAPVQPVLQSGEDSPSSVDIGELAAFCKNPVRYYYQLLGVYYGEEEWIIPEEEPLDDGDTLIKHALKTTRLTHDTAEEVHTLREKLQMRGLWPLDGYGDYVVEKTCAPYEPVFKTMQELSAEKSVIPRHHMVCTTESHTITVTGENLPCYMYGGTGIYAVPSVSSAAAKPKYMIEALLYSLFLSSCDTIDYVQYAGAKKGTEQSEILTYPALDCDEAYTKLSRILSLFIQVRQNIPVLFGPAAGRACAKDRDMTTEEIIRKLQSEDAQYDPSLRHFLTTVDADLFDAQYRDNFTLLSEIFFPGEAQK
ncbi:MAG: exodeoxyribonuclease V subunit gamma [Fibrobacterota bacterium]